MVERAGQIGFIGRVAQETCLAFDDIFPYGSDVTGYNGQSKTIGQEKHSTLKDRRIRQRQNIRGFEIEFDLVIANVTDLFDHLFAADFWLKPLLDFLNVLFAIFLGLAGNDQLVIGVTR